MCAALDAIADWAARVAALEQCLRPIADRPVDVTDPHWVARARSLDPPLDRAGVRAEVEQLLTELVGGYVNGDDATRSALRRLFHDHTAFSWATGWAEQQPGAEGIRRRLVLFSLRDQEQDSRDALLTLQAICDEAAASTVDLDALLREAAELSSTVDRYGMGSTRELLLRRFGGGSESRSPRQPR